jgi:MoaA/NifB/PqqE/SkfB family radical SAM enzyme
VKESTPNPQEHVEIQLGHLCNNRCVFCVSGQLSEQKRAGQIPAEGAIERLERAHRNGARRVTLLGGEPTLQRSFFEVLHATQRLGFEEVTIFTNGVMVSKDKFLAKVMDVGEFTWRFSLQGADRESHDAVTVNPGSFDRITKAMRSLKQMGQRVTTNLCVTSVNVASLPHYPAIVQELGIEDVHLDMVRPLDAGERTEDYLTSILPPYPVVATYVEEMLDRFPPGAEAHVGNLPYCLLPERAHHIFHDGVNTITFAANGRNGLDDGWDKYETKRRDKDHHQVCEGCAFKSSCNGLFDSYVESHGLAGIKAISVETLWAQEATRLSSFRVLSQPLLEAIEKAEPLEPGLRVLAQTQREAPHWMQVTFQRDDEPAHVLAIRPRTENEGTVLGSTTRVAIYGGPGTNLVRSDSVVKRANWLLDTILDSKGAGQEVTRSDPMRVEATLLAQRLLAARLAGLDGEEVRLELFPSLSHARIVHEPRDGGWVSLSLVAASQKLQLSYAMAPGMDPALGKERLQMVLGSLKRNGQRPKARL